MKRPLLEDGNDMIEHWSVEALERSTVSSATTLDEAAAILSARALALAEEPITENEAGGLDVLQFRLTPETYGIESSYVREVYPLREFTALPCTPPFVLGITSVRGSAVNSLRG